MIAGGRTSTATVRAGQTVRPPTTAGGDPTVIALPPTDASTINNQIDDATRRRADEGVVTGGQQSILTVNPILEQPQGGDRAKIETIVNGHLNVPTGQ